MTKVGDQPFINPSEKWQIGGSDVPKEDAKTTKARQAGGLAKATVVEDELPTGSMRGSDGVSHTVSNLTPKLKEPTQEAKKERGQGVPPRDAAAKAVEKELSSMGLGSKVLIGAGIVTLLSMAVIAAIVFAKMAEKGRPGSEAELEAGGMPWDG